MYTAVICFVNPQEFGADVITEDLSEYIAIALLAVHEKAKGKDSFWSSYIGVLPTVEEVRGELQEREGKGGEGRAYHTGVCIHPAVSCSIAEVLHCWVLGQAYTCSKVILVIFMASAGPESVVSATISVNENVWKSQVPPEKHRSLFPSLPFSPSVSYARVAVNHG